MRLHLTKIAKGRYTKRAGSILVNVEKCSFSDMWIGRIENMTHWAKDMAGNDVEIGDELMSWKSSTKKQLVTVLTNWIIEN